MTTQPLTNKELEDTLGHTEGLITITGKCHENAPIGVHFHIEDCCIWLICTACNTLVTKIAVEKTQVH